MRALNMRSRRHQGLVAFALALCAEPAWAFLDPPYLTPADPVTDEVVSVNIYGGECDAIVGIEGYPQIIQQGNLIRIVFFSVHYDDPEFCNLGAGTATTPIGTYPPGNYTLQVERRYMTVFATWIQETLGVVPFTISSAPQQQPIETPTLSLAGLTALLLALIGAVLHKSRKRLA
jgi:hypothetical protein